MTTSNGSSRISWIRIILITIGLLSALPLSLLFGLYGLIVALFFVLMVILAT